MATTRMLKPENYFTVHSADNSQTESHTAYRHERDKWHTSLVLRTYLFYASLTPHSQWILIIISRVHWYVFRTCVRSDQFGISMNSPEKKKAYFATNSKWWRGCLKTTRSFLQFLWYFFHLKRLKKKGSSSFQIHFRDRNTLFCLLFKSLFAFLWITSKIDLQTCARTSFEKGGFLHITLLNHFIAPRPHFSWSEFKIRLCVFLL